MKVRFLRTAYLVTLSLSAIATLILIGFPGNKLNGIIESGLNFALFQALAIIFYHGKKLQPYKSNQFFLVFPFIVIALLFKIMHWKGADTLIIIAFGCMLIFYSIRFYQKVIKRRLDWLKWIWVLFELSSRLFLIFHWSGTEQLLIISNVLLVSILLDFLLYAPGIGLLQNLIIKENTSNYRN